MISEIGNINNEESPKKNYFTENQEKSRMSPKDENANDNLKEITMLMRQILEE